MRRFHADDPRLKARGRDFGLNLGVDEERLYPDDKTLIAEEAEDPEHRRYWIL